MLQAFRELTLSLNSKSVEVHRTNTKHRIEPLQGQLTDLYRERLPVAVVNVSASALGVKVQERFAVDLPVLIQCEGMVVVGNVRHCIKAADGGYVLGLEIHKRVDLARSETSSGDTPRRVPMARAAGAA